LIRLEEEHQVFLRVGDELVLVSVFGMEPEDLCGCVFESLLLSCKGFLGLNVLLVA